MASAHAQAEVASLSPHQQKEAVELIRRLGDNSFQVREEASNRLFKMGLAAKPFLLEGSRDADLEIRRRCTDLLPAVLDADLQERIAAFLADRDGKKEHDLPGWKRYRKLIGDDPAARVLFAELQKAETGRFLADCDARPDTAGDMLQGRAQMLQQRLYNPQSGHQPLSIGDVATLLFIGSDERVRVPLQAVYVLNSFFYQQTIKNAVAGSAAASPLKRLLLAWMKGQTDPNVVQQNLYMAMNLDLKEAVDVALKIARDKNMKGHPLGLALVTIGKLGGKQHLADFEPFLADATLIGNFAFNQVRGTTEVRDVALGMLVELTGQAHKEYGFAFVETNAALKFNPFYLGFKTPEQRQAAFKKWQAYAATQKKK